MEENINYTAGIILQYECIVSNKQYHYYSEMLNALGFENSQENEATLFVKVELKPENGAWWTNPENWEFSVKQNIVPEWFHGNEKYYRNAFIDAMKDWWNEHIFVDKKIELLTNNSYWLKRCVVDKLAGDVHVSISETTVKEMCDNSIVGIMDDYSIIEQMYDNAKIDLMMNCCIVGKMKDQSYINIMTGSSMVQEMHENSCIREMFDMAMVCCMYDSSKISSMTCSSSIKKMFGNSMVENVTGMAVVQEMLEASKVKNLFYYGSVTSVRDLKTFYSKVRKRHFKVKYQSIISN